MFLIVLASLQKNLKLFPRPIPLPSLIVSFFFFSFFNQLAIHFPNKRQFKNWKLFKGKFLNDLIFIWGLPRQWGALCCFSKPLSPSCLISNWVLSNVIVWALNYHWHFLKKNKTLNRNRMLINAFVHRVHTAWNQTILFLSPPSINEPEYSSSTTDLSASLYMYIRQLRDWCFIYRIFFSSRQPCIFYDKSSLKKKLFLPITLCIVISLKDTYWLCDYRWTSTTLSTQKATFIKGFFPSSLLAHHYKQESKTSFPCPISKFKFY